MAAIRLIKRAKYAGDVHAELIKLGWNLDAATLFVENIPDVDVVPEWTKPEDGLPEEGEYVLCWCEYFRFGRYNRMFRNYGIGYQYNGNWGGEVSYGRDTRVLAWMPLPKPPKKGNHRRKENKG